MSDYKRLVITHKDCTDGLCCQAIFKKFFGVNEATTEYIDVSHNEYNKEKFPEEYDALNKKILSYKDKDVYMADICLPYEMLEKIINNKNSLTVIDHHIFVKDSIDKLKDLKNKGHNIQIAFSEDNSESGAKLTWKHLLPNLTPPKVVEYVSDGDLYEFKHKETKAFYLGLYDGLESPKDLPSEKFLDLIASEKTDGKELNEVIEKGSEIVEKNRREVIELSKNKQKIVFDGIEGYLCYSPSKHKSDLGNYLATEIGTYAILSD